MLTRIKTPERPVVGLSEVKAHLRLDHAHEDAYLETLIQAATGFVEEYLGRSLLTQAWRVTWETEKTCPPHLFTLEEDVCSVSLPYPPLRRILEVSRLMVKGDKQPIRRHRLEVNHSVPKLFFASVPEPVEIDFETGYGNHPTDLPPMVRQALLMVIADFYENRDSSSVLRNTLVRDILNIYRVVRLP